MECFWSDLTKHPQCPHGPTLLFGTYENGRSEKFYACSACRERKLCKFYLKEQEKLTKQQTAKWERERKQFTSRYHHRSLYIHFNGMMSLPSEERCYCRTCEKLICKTETVTTEKHKGHDIKESLTDYEMQHPTEILKPLEDSKQEAQYFFTEKATEDITNMLVKLGAKQVLCIGTPKIHEHIIHKYEDKISSLLLDFDGRFHNFFGPLSYCWYNLLNNHFFNDSSMHTFRDFIMQNNGRDTYLICDPPFGSRVEPMSWTIKKISDLHKKWNNIEDDNDLLKIMFIFPYFMEPIMKRKSNPPGISGGLKELKMTDYKVSYVNHPLFVTTSKANKLPSPIRIFTNISLQLLELPRSDGYKYCKKCEKWISKENKHCKKCDDCTSKNGLTYQHCDICKRCVKPNWKHCETCKRCTLIKHSCGKKPKTSGKCFKCNEYGHTEKECNANQENQGKVIKKVKKRKLNEKRMENEIKKKKVDDSHKFDEEGNEKSIIRNAKKSGKTLEKKGKRQTTPELKVKVLKKSKSLKLHKKTKLRVRLNGVAKIKKKIKNPKE